MKPDRGFDYVVVGAGAAGCVLANRLSADPTVRVALIEAGPSDRAFPVNIKSSLPIGNVFLLPHARYNWRHEFVGGAGVNDRSIALPRGKLLGGCTSVNGSVYIRGHRDDYDRWAALGNDGWSYDDVLPAFKVQENWSRGQSAFHGSGGELDVIVPVAVNPLSAAFVAAATAVGHQANADFNGASQDGFGLWDITQRRGLRLSASRAFLHPVMHRANLEVLTDCLVERICLDRGRATGVVVVHKGARRTVAAANEVIVSAGAINSPQLLLLSGIGPAKDLERHSIPVQADRPGVGHNLQDHPSVIVSRTDASRQSYALAATSIPRIAADTLAYLYQRTGMLASNTAECGGFLRTTPGLDRPDLQVTLFPGLKDPARPIPRRYGVMAFVSVLRPATRGRVELASARPDAHPLVHPAFLEDPADIDALVAGIRAVRRIYAAPPLDRMLGGELSPGSRAESYAELAAVVRAGLVTVHHPVGTCKMGPASDPYSVVDARLRVHDVQGLRVADASVMPDIIGGNTSAPTMMIGERCAAFLLGDETRPPSIAERGLPRAALSLT